MLKKIWQPVVLVVAVLLLWEATVRVFAIQSFLLPAPSAIIERVWTDRAYLLENTPVSLYEIVIGFAIGLLVGMALAIPVALTSFGQNAVMPLLVAIQTIPKVALAPLFVIWLGFGPAPKIAIAALLTFFPIVVNMSQGLRSVESELVQYLRTLGARPAMVFFRLRLPFSAPYLFAGMKSAIPLAVTGAIVGEFIQASEGLGYVILRSINNFDTALTFAGIVVVSLIGVVLYGVIAAIERILLGWHVAITTQNR